MVAQQVTRIERQIEQDAALFPPSSFRCIHYSDLSPELLANLAEFIGARDRRNGSLPEFRIDVNDDRIDPARRTEIERALDAAGLGG